MSCAHLVIFIDAFPYRELAKAGFLSGFAHRRQLRPNIGYSVNLQAELFTGKNPDELGYFCDWTYHPAASPFYRWGGLLPLLAPLERAYVPRRIVHKILSRLAGVECKDIPVCALPLFSPHKKDPFSEAFPGGSLFTEFGFCLSRCTDYGGALRLRDAAVFERAKQSLHRAPLLVAMLGSLDACGHWHGVGSRAWDERIGWLDDSCRELCGLFCRSYPEGRIAVLSDHGMSNVRQGHAIDLARLQHEGCACFVDGTIIRVWCLDGRSAAGAAAYLESLSWGSLLTEAERQEAGLTARSFGDLIFIADEGEQIAPSFWGARLSLGMHGYRACPAQMGIALFSWAPGPEGDTLRAGEVYRALRASLLPTAA